MADKKSHSMTKDRGVAIHDKHPCDPPGDPDGDRDPDLGGGDDLDGEEEEDEDESASAMAANIADDRELKALPVVLLFKSNFQAFLNPEIIYWQRSCLDPAVRPSLLEEN